MIFSLMIDFSKARAQLGHNEAGMFCTLLYIAEYTNSIKNERHLVSVGKQTKYCYSLQKKNSEESDGAHPFPLKYTE